MIIFDVLENHLGPNHVCDVELLQLLPRLHASPLSKLLPVVPAAMVMPLSQPLLKCIRKCFEAAAIRLAAEHRSIPSGACSDHPRTGPSSSQQEDHRRLVSSSPACCQ